MSIAGEIFGHLFSLGVPSRLPAPWENLACDRATFDLQQDSAELVANLAARFQPRELVKAGVLAAGAVEPAALNPMLDANRSYLTALRKRPGEKPYDVLVGSAGSLAGEWPWSQAIEDHEIKSRISREGGRLFVAESAADVAVLRSLGVPVASAAGLDWLTGERFTRFCQALGIDGARREEVSTAGKSPSDKSRSGRSPARKSRSRKSRSGKSRSGKSRSGKSRSGKSSERRSPPPTPDELRLPTSLVLTNWSLAPLDCSDQPLALKIRNHLLKLRDDRILTLDDHVVWKPSEEKVAAVAECLRNGRELSVPAVLFDDLEADCELPDHWSPEGSSQKDSYADALRSLSLGADDRVSPERSYDSERLLEFQDSQIIGRLLEAAAQTKDPIEMNRLYMLAHLSRLFFADIVVSPQSTWQEKMPQWLALTGKIMDLSDQSLPWKTGSIRWR